MLQDICSSYVLLVPNSQERRCDMCYLCLVGSKDDSYITSEFPEDPVNLQSPLRVC